MEQVLIQMIHFSSTMYTIGSCGIYDDNVNAVLIHLSDCIECYYSLLKELMGDKNMLHKERLCDDFECAILNTCWHLHCDGTECRYESPCIVCKKNKVCKLSLFDRIKNERKNEK